jgi:crossover junction endodeoxyribonuclease RusA
MEKPLTLNRERTLHRMQRAQFVKHWREQFGWLGREAKMGPSDWIAVSAIPYQKRGPLQDVSSCHPAVKAAIDGLVDIGVVPDDTPQFVPTITYLPPQRGNDGLILIVELYGKEK